MTHMAKRQKRTLGDVVLIDLGDGLYGYARTLEEALYAFYDCHTKQVLPVDEIVRRPVLFQVAVMDHAVKSGRWKVLGNVALDGALLNPPARFIQDPLRPDQFSLYEKGRTRPATRAEAVGLERAAVWEPSHVEDRLRDHYAGRKNKWVESLRIESGGARTN
jgi:hypothetical protein